MMVMVMMITMMIPSTSRGRQTPSKVSAPLQTLADDLTRQKLREAPTTEMFAKLLLLLSTGVHEGATLFFYLTLTDFLFGK